MPHCPNDVITKSVVTRGERLHTAMVRSMSNVDADPMAVLPANWLNAYYVHRSQSFRDNKQVEKKRAGTYERLTVDLGGHICSNIDTNDGEPDRILAIKVEERRPMGFTLLYASSWVKGLLGCIRQITCSTKGMEERAKKNLARDDAPVVC